MGDKSKSINYDERISNLRSLYNKYSISDQQYLSDKLSETININFSNIDISLTTKNVKNDDSIKSYLIDPVYMNILSIISELKDYRALEKVLYTDETNKIDKDAKESKLIPGNSNNKSPTQLYSGNIITNDVSASSKNDNKMINADFNSQFDNQLARNRIDKVKEEQERLQFLIDNVTPADLSSEKSTKFFHEMTMAEIIDNFANSIVTLFKQVYSMDIDGLINSQNNYIYYGFIMIFIYLVLRLTWQDLNS